MGKSGCHVVSKFLSNASGSSGGHFCNLWKWRHLVVKFGTNASGDNLQLTRVAPFGGQICNYFKWHHLMANFTTVQVVSSGSQICKWYPLMAKFGTNVNAVIWLLKVTESICGSFVPLAMFDTEKL